jgi:NAD(P)-dependent dehydrogenase (short-subunit alcohol dehydrogenase family)
VGSAVDDVPSLMTAPPLPPGELFDLTGRVAIVTGASSGLGERFARVLHAAGASVVAVARRSDRLNGLAAQLDRVLPVTADLGVDADIARIVPRAMERFHRLDILVNNAGFGVPSPALAEPIAMFRRTLEVNLVASFQLAREAASVMITAGGGSIINISSILGLGAAWPMPDASYSSSKGALISLTRDLACQWAAHGVRVNALAPGYFPSESSAPLMNDEAGQRYLRTGCPMKRMGRTEELDGALLYLSSGASTYVTGQVLVVDGGWTAH